MKKLMSLLLLSAVLSACSEKKPVKVERAFYYWKSDGLHQIEALRRLKTQKLYVKYFEIDFSGEMGAFPIDKTYSKGKIDSTFAVVPTVFIRNEVFLKSSQGEIDTLAENVRFLIDKYVAYSNNKDIPAEWQFDCDWTPKSRDNYFRFLKKIKAISGKQISCTLRLYPFKYRTKMGVPPVDRAMLMCYNLIQPLEDKTRNSILDVDELKAYLTVDEKYPLPLDVALPIFSWMHLYHNGKFSGLVDGRINKFGAAVKKTKPIWYEFVKDTVIDYEHYFREGDQIKFEEITTKQLFAAQKLLVEKLKLHGDVTVSLFHFDNEQLSAFKDDEIEKLYSGFTASGK
ncbi:hypothetical protein [Flavobacterium sp.]|uniref:hypothetical protein n=1 Tax=Flavobacterium sp. TaxID=239 RepID=UPI001203B264|nr:hypothetical protein [Flavobacterium sp.]RZJ69080.1 MAG: hypothetical protein EOO49_18720 [Flavobacterium sp.]